MQFYVLYEKDRYGLELERGTLKKCLRKLDAVARGLQLVKLKRARGSFAFVDRRSKIRTYQLILMQQTFKPIQKYSFETDKQFKERLERINKINAQNAAKVIDCK